MAFRAHLVLLIRQRGFANAANMAWEITKRLRRQGLEAYVASIEPPEPSARQRTQRARLPRKERNPSDKKPKNAVLNSAPVRSTLPRQQDVQGRPRFGDA